MLSACVAAVMRLRWRFATYLFLLVLTGPHPASAQATAWAEAGELVFDVLKGENGIKLGEARHAWSHDGSRYTMTLTLETTGLAGLLYDFRYTQRSEGWVTAGGLRPERFGVTQSGRKPERADFDWTGGKVRVERKGQASYHDLRVGDQDVLSVWHLFARAGDKLPERLLLVTNRRAAPTTITRLGRERVEVPAGSLEAARYRVRADTGKLTIDLWLGHREGVPVRLLMTDDKGQVLDLQLRAPASAAR